jgi:hypothetical protein
LAALLALAAFVVPSIAAVAEARAFTTSGFEAPTG